MKTLTRTFAAALASTLVLSGCGRESEPGALPAPSAPGPTTMFARERTFVANVDDVVAAADAIVIGTYTEVRPGRVLGDPREALVPLIATTLDVEELLYGQAPSELLVEETGDLATGVGINTARFPVVGDRVIIALVRTRNEGVDAGLDAWRLVSTQTRWFVGADGRLAHNYFATAHGPYVDTAATLAARGFDRLVSDLRSHGG